MTGLLCPACGIAGEHGVKDVRPNMEGLRRRRLCDCGHRFTTAEVVVPPIGTRVIVANRSAGPSRVSLTIVTMPDIDNAAKALMAERIAEAVSKVLMT